MANAWAEAWRRLAEDLELRRRGEGGRRDRLEHDPETCGMCLLMDHAHAERARYARKRSAAAEARRG